MKKVPLYIFASLAVLAIISKGCADLSSVNGPDEISAIKSVKPISGSSGATVTITGSGFETDHEVLFDDIQATIASSSDTSIVTRVPSSAQTGPIYVVVNLDTLQGPIFTIDTTRTSGLVINNISPDRGIVGSRVEVSGSGFSSSPEGNEIFFNSLAADVVSASGTLLVTTVPDGADTGPVSVAVNQDTVAGPVFTVVELTVNSITPNTGPLGTSVAINGQGFSAEPTENTVTFNGTPAEVVSSGFTEIQTIVPEEATSGEVVVAVHGQVATGPAFTVDDDAPSITSVQPSSARRGTSVTISGQNFSTVAEENVITFNGVNAPVNSATATQLTTVVPQNATDGPVEVTVNGENTAGPVFDVIIIDRLAIEPASASIMVSETINLTATVFDEENRPVNDVVISWSSGNSAVASIDNTGMVTAIAEGTAEITAESEGLSGTAQITVTTEEPPVARIEITPNPATVRVEKFLQLNATVFDADDNVINATVSWSIGDTEIATIDADGEVRGQDVGQTTVTATSGSITGTATVTVEPGEPETIELAPDPAVVKVGETVAMTATIKDESDNVVPGAVVETWLTVDNNQTVDETIAKVDANGVVTGVDVGEAFVVALSGAAEGAARVTVVPGDPDTIELSPNPAVLKTNESINMSAIILDEAGNIVPGAQVDTWLIEDEAIATVNMNGQVTGLSAGETRVLAQSGTAQGFATVIVEERVASFISVEPDPANVQVGKTVQMTATVFDASENELPDAQVIWSVDNASIAFVDANGVVTGENVGQTTVRASSGGATGSAVVNVSPGDPARVTVSPDPATVQEGATVQMTATVFDEAENVLPDADVTWASDAPSIADVDVNGVVTGVSAGETFVTATSGSASGTAVVIVESSGGQAPVILPETITAGDNHSCGLDNEGNAYCWGRNGSGQLGDGTTIQQNVPVAVRMPSGISFTLISAGGGHTVALDSDGRAWSWGWNTYGALGDGTNNHSSTPVLVNMPAGVSFTSVDAGLGHNVALTSDGQAYAWGYNNFRQLGDGTNTQRNSPIPVTMPSGVSFTIISAGRGHTVALTSNGEAWTWGNDGTTSVVRSTPVLVNTPVGLNLAVISAGSFYTMALDTGGTAWAWGENGQGQLGDGTNNKRSDPVQVSMPAGITFSTISAGNLHSLALDNTGQAYAWGLGSGGRLGNGVSNDQKLFPILVSMPTGVNFIKINTGSSLSLALDSNGQAWTWGFNNNGQLGDGTTTNRSIPVEVQMPPGVIFE